MHGGNEHAMHGNVHGGGKQCVGTVGRRGGGGYGRRGEHEGAPSGVERECGQCGLDRGGIGSGGIGSSGIHGGIAGLVFG